MDRLRMDGQDPESLRAGIEPMISQAEPAIDEIAAFAKRAAEALDLEDVRKLLDEIRDYIREHPLAAVALGLAAGYLLSRLTRSGRA